jgi:hypothetical protein
MLKHNIPFLIYHRTVQCKYLESTSQSSVNPTFTPKQCDSVVNAINDMLMATSVSILCRSGLSFSNAVNSADWAVNVAMEQMFASLCRISVIHIKFGASLRIAGSNRKTKRYCGSLVKECEAHMYRYDAYRGREMYAEDRPVTL